MSRTQFTALRRAAFMVAILAPAAWAQFESATVLGLVRDATGAVVPNATVRLENVRTGIVDTTKTDSTGNYQFLSVRIGVYQLKVEAPGFATAVTEPFDVTVSARQRVDITLQVRSTTETITVTDAARPLETDSSDRGHVVRAEQILSLPLNGRSYAQLALLAPGVRRSTMNREASFNVNGQRASLNNFILDGLDNNAYATSNQGFSNQVVQPSPDALEEFRVQTNNYSAEYGRASGAVINATIRSGTNQFRGSAWEFVRNTRLNAVGFFKPVENQKPVLNQNQFGATLGGPLRRDRAFFFVDYEGFRNVTRSLSWQTLPTMEQRQGILGVPVRHPLTGALYPDGRIPASEITRFARKVLDDMPPTNLPGPALNFKWLPRGQSYSDKGNAKLDYRFNDRWNAFVRLSHRKVNQFEPPSFPGPSGGTNNGNVRILNQHLAAAVNWLAGPRTLVETRLGLSRTDAGKFPPLLGGPNMRELYGIRGLPEDPKIAGGLCTINLTGFASIGRQSSNPQFQNPFVTNPKINFSHIAGGHTIKTGYEYQAVNTEVDDFNPKYGTINYTGQFSRAPGAASSYLYTLADFMLDLPYFYNISSIAIVNIRQRMHFGYIQDDWKIHPRLTLNLGMRYEFATPQYERDNRLSNFDPASGRMVLARAGSVYERARVRPDRNNFAPRIGLAWTFTPRTVVRTAYGISYVHFNRLGAENLLALNWPFALDARITQSPTQPLCREGDDPATCFRQITTMGFPASVMLDPARVTTAHMGYTYFIPEDTRTAYVQSWHFTIQRELGRGWVLDLAYVGNHGLKFVVLADWNQARPNAPNENTPLQNRRPYRDYQNIQISWPVGFLHYHGLQTKLERRLSKGLQFTNAFTWSKAIDNGPGHLEVAAGDNSRVNFHNLRSEKGLSNYDQPITQVTTLVWDLPWGKNRRWGASLHPLLEGFLGGWRLSVINAMNSGLPFTLRYSAPSEFNVSGLPSYRPNVVGEPLAPEAERQYDNYLSRTNVVIPTDRSNPFGNASRNMRRGYAYYNMDLGLHKHFVLPGEQRRLEVRGEFFNFLNKTNFTVPDSNRSSASYGRISATHPARQIQLALKLYF